MADLFYRVFSRRGFPPKNRQDGDSILSTLLIQYWIVGVRDQDLVSWVRCLIPAESTLSDRGLPWRTGGESHLGFGLQFCKPIPSISCYFQCWRLINQICLVLSSYTAIAMVCVDLEIHTYANCYSGSRLSCGWLLAAQNTSTALAEINQLVIRWYCISLRKSYQSLIYFLLVWVVISGRQVLDLFKVETVNLQAASCCLVCYCRVHWTITDLIIGAAGYVILFTFWQ